MHAFLALSKLESLTSPHTPDSKGSNMELRNTDPRAAQATLFIAQKGLSDQGRGYYLPKSVLQDVCSRMTARDSTILQSFIAIRQEESKLAKERKVYMESLCPPDILQLAKDAEQQLDENWIRRFAKLTVGEESGSLILGMISRYKNS
uniref:WGS project CBMG000000000 data, contig CS5907-c002057 n=1 Tax=Fusarium acuminatum CS5907 TaxID=1318461 RepID=A0A090MDK3_9HYPO|nr:unnamed protein product [Fusarium acuminatum CS5907]